MDRWINAALTSILVCLGALLVGCVGYWLGLTIGARSPETVMVMWYLVVALMAAVVWRYDR